MNKRIYKVWVLVFLDIISFFMSFLWAYMIKFDGIKQIPTELRYHLVDGIILMVVAKLIILILMKMYSKIWRFAGITEMIDVIIAAAVGTGVVMGGLFLISRHPELSKVLIPRSILLLSFIFDVIFIGGTRFSYRLFFHVSPKEIIRHQHQKRVLIYGAGQAGVMVLKELNARANNEYAVVGFMDDDVSKKGQRMHGLFVYGNKQELLKTLAKEDINMLVLAMPSASEVVKKEILNLVKDTGVKISILPKVHDIIDGTIAYSSIRPVEIEDLLGREQVQLNNRQISKYLEGKRVMVTGGGGSIGSELCRQIAKYKPDRLIIVDIYENNAYDIQLELKRTFPNLALEVFIASVRDEKRIKSLFERFRPQVVFHAAAHKHVPLMEDSPEEAIKNNVFGTYNVAKSAFEFESEKFVLISTDKAVNPTNVMGASKRLCEMVVQAFASQKHKTEFVAVRFGNVLGSNGSVIPIFKKQIKEGGPVTVTHPDIIRYFMTIPEAAQLVIQAGGFAMGGEIFVLDMGDPVKIDTLARDLIRLSGFEPDVDIKVTYSGLRPGEKLYEELLMSEEGLVSTENEKIFVAKPMDITLDELLKGLDRLKETLEEMLPIVPAIKAMVPTFKTPDEVNQAFLKE
ncbi:nucleoside-diphosphate sugar epimerase/dehydratase [Fusibacter sp. 3D3]|uniref:polysaccharide biosynthesis protein n=1 Tax=Fusibacter sp. 3D3 TaxID=1048380 RepID=UPI0008561E32|nr:nucleoside-diphosphate sugar epimerase/dehydratase [Fusibacter sp. 3D3]GAU77745.1 UDP-N-acetylglucosamine 4,6-dehydratase [Fusibacter sp. 3D3]